MSDQNEVSGCFTLAQANALLPRIIALTEQTTARLEACRHPWTELGFRKFNLLAEMPEEDLLRLRWAAQMARLGAAPRGCFVVDFQSPDPGVVYCWRWGERNVAFQHGKTESCDHRRPLPRE